MRGGRYPMNIAVTGAHGFVGLNLVHRLAQEGHSLYAVGRHQPDSWVDIFLSDVASSVQHRQADLALPGELVAAMEDDTLDAVIHAAVITATTPGVERDNARGIVDVNVGGTMEALTLARRKGARRFVYISSPSAIGAAAGDGPIDEHVELNPASIYGITKMSSEYLVRRASEIYDLSTASVRIAQPYGPGERATQSRVRTSPIYEWLRDAGEEAPLPTGPLNRSRDWTYIEDTARGIGLLATAENLQHDLYHLGTGRQISVGDVIAALKVEFPNLRTDMNPPADVLNPNIAGGTRGPLDVSRFRSEFAWAPDTGIDEGMRQYMRWWKQFQVDLESCEGSPE